MSYEKQTWVTGETITASKLNHMEDGIASGGGSFLITATPTGATTLTIDKTYNEILTALASGQIPIINVVVNGEYKKSFVYHRTGSADIEFSEIEYSLEENNVIVSIFDVYVLSDNTIELGQFAYTASAVNEQ